LNSDGGGLGIAVCLRQASLKTNDLFGTGTDFDGGGTYFAGVLRYRF